MDRSWNTRKHGEGPRSAILSTRAKTPFMPPVSQSRGGNLRNVATTQQSGSGRCRVGCREFPGLLPDESGQIGHTSTRGQIPALSRLSSEGSGRQRGRHSASAGLRPQRGTLFQRKERPTGRREIAGQGVQAPEKEEKADAPWPTNAHLRPARLDQAAVVPDRVARNEYLFRRLANASEPKEAS